LVIILEAMEESSDLVRENAARILHYLFPKCMKIHKYVPYIIEKLVKLTNCIDLENQNHLPE